MFDWEDYLKIAHNFLAVSPGLPESEAYYRCGISRAYYSMFHKSKRFILAKKSTFDRNKDEGSHEAVIRILTELKNPAGSLLARLKYDRVGSDYYDDRQIDEKTFRKALFIATDISKLVSI